MKLKAIRVSIMICLLTSAISLPIFGQYNYSPEILKPVLPKAYVISEYEEISEKYAADYHHLLDVCDGDIDVAFNKWLEMLMTMEVEAEKNELDLRGTKMWLQVYFSNNGSIDHIGFFLKPNSKNINQAELTAFFQKFAGQYQFPIDANKKFSHYTAVSFPVFTGS